MHRTVRFPVVLISASLVAVSLDTGSALTIRSASAAATTSVTVPASAWLRGWPMDRHDAQRTNLSPVSGTLHPRLVSQQSDFSGRLLAPNGSVIGTAGIWPHVAMAALLSNGKLAKLSTRVTEASAIRRDGAILEVGADNSRALAVSASGTFMWQQKSIGLPKSAQPLVTNNGRFFIAAEGHPQDGTSGLYVLSRQGKVIHHVARGEPIFDIAVGLDGSVYTLLYDWATGVSYAVAYSPGLQEQWRYKLTTSLEQSSCDCLMAGSGGRLYVGNGGTLLTLDAHGHLAWSLAKPDGSLSMAERPDGSVLLAGSRTLTAISAQGQILWNADIRIRHTIGANDSVRAPTLAVDSAGTAYVGTADGRIVVVDSTGLTNARIPAGGYRYGQTPLVMLGPRHTLVVAATDSIVRIYR